MTEISLTLHGGGRLQIFGPPAARRVVLVLSRDQFRLDDLLVARLAQGLADRDLAVMRYESEIAVTTRLLDRPFLRRLPRPLQLALKSLLLLGYPRRWTHFSRRRRERQNDFEFRIRALGEVVDFLGRDREIIVLARSAGARVATLAADRLGLRRILCLGYPFQHPDEGPDASRYAHLAGVQASVLILQGERDNYGGREWAGKCPLGPAMRLEWIDCDHDFSLDEDEWPRVLALVRSFIESAGREAAAPVAAAGARP